MAQPVEIAAAAAAAAAEFAADVVPVPASGDERMSDESEAGERRDDMDAEGRVRGSEEGGEERGADFDGERSAAFPGPVNSLHDAAAGATTMEQLLLENTQLRTQVAATRVTAAAVGPACSAFRAPTNMPNAEQSPLAGLAASSRQSARSLVRERDRDETDKRKVRSPLGGLTLGNLRSDIKKGFDTLKENLGPKAQKQEPKDKQQSEWTKNLVMDMLMTANSHVERRFDVVETSMNRLKDDQEEAFQFVQDECKQIRELHTAQDSELKRLEAKLTAKIDALQGDAAPSSPRSHGAAESSTRASTYASRASTTAIDRDARQEGMMGGLGRDVPDTELKTRAQTVLNRCGVDSTSYSCINPCCRTGGVGSMCEIFFKSPQQLSLARMLVSATRVIVALDVDAKQAWFGSKKQ